MKASVYFVQGETTRHIKIGSSSDIVRRLGQLRTGSGERHNFLGCLELADGWTESELHEDFAAHRVRGEWFEPVLRLRRFIVAYAHEHECLSCTPPFPPASEPLPTCRVWWKQHPVLDFDAIRDALAPSP